MGSLAAHLQSQLDEARRTRNEWCEEYTKARDLLIWAIQYVEAELGSLVDSHTGPDGLDIEVRTEVRRTKRWLKEARSFTAQRLCEPGSSTGNQLDKHERNSTNQEK